MADWLTDDVVAAVVTHMNGDHADDNVVICRGAGGRPAVTQARMTGLTAEAIVFAATEPGGEVVVRVPFGAPLSSRAEVREHVARLFHESVELLARAGERS